MTIALRTIQPYIPPFPYGAGVADGKAIFVNGASHAETSHIGRFAIVDPVANTSVGYALSSIPSGHNANYCSNGVDYGGGVLVLFANAKLWAAHVFPDGNVDAYPSPSLDSNSPWGVRVGSKIWSIASNSSSYPVHTFDLSTMTWDSTPISGSSGTRSDAAPFVHDGFVWAWSGSGTTWHKLDVATGARTTVTAPEPMYWGQAAGVGSDVYLPSATSGHLIKASGGTLTNVSAPVFVQGGPWTQSLVRDGQGYLRSVRSDGASIVGWHPDTGVSWTESTGITGGSSCTRAVTIDGETVAAVWKPGT